MVLLEICCRNQTGDKRSQPLAQSSIFIIMLFLTSPSIHCICVLPENAFHITLKNVLVCRKIQVTTTQQFFFCNNELSRLNLTMDIIDTETDYGHYKRLKVLNVVHKNDISVFLQQLTCQLFHQTHELLVLHFHHHDFCELPVPVNITNIIL